MSNEIRAEEGTKVVFLEKVVANPNSALWAQVSVLTPDGHVHMSTAKDEVILDGHLEYIRFVFPELQAGEYPYIVVVGDPHEELHRFIGTLIYEKKAKPVVKAKKPRAKKKIVEPVKEKVETLPEVRGEYDGKDADNLEVSDL